MSKWRIKSKTYCPAPSFMYGVSVRERGATLPKTSYILQKRLLGFLWWYNPDNFNEHTTGVYDSYDDAMIAYEHKMFVPSVMIHPLGGDDDRQI